MGAKTTAKGEIGELQVMADLSRQGHDVAIPFGHNQPFDLIVIRKEDGRLEKVQVKYTTSDGRVVFVKVESTSAWVRHAYTPSEVDWIAVYDATSEMCFYLPSSVWGGYSGGLNIRLKPTANGQKKLTRSAYDFIALHGDPRVPRSGSFDMSALPLQKPPG